MSIRDSELLPGGVPLIAVTASTADEEYTLPAGYASGRKLMVRREDSTSHIASVRVRTGGSLDDQVNGVRLVPADAEVMFICQGDDAWQSYGPGSFGGVPVDIGEVLALKADRDLGNVTVETALESLGLGDVATLDVGTAAGTVAAGDDERFTNARTPTAHASSHEDGGDDELELAQAQITGLPDALDAKADLVAGKVPSAQIPAITFGGEQAPSIVNSEAAMLALDVDQGAVAIRPDVNKTFILSTSDASDVDNWFEIIAPDQVTSVAGKTGTVSLVPTDVTGLPAALDAKADTSALTGKAATDLSNVVPAAIRTRAELGGAALLNVGASAGTVAAGNDTRVTGAAQRVGGNTFTGTQDFTSATVVGIGGGGGSVTLPYTIVAATNAPTAWKNVAAYTCDGVDDAAEINSAINALTTTVGALGGTVILSPGTFTIGKTSPTDSGTTASNSDSSVLLRTDVNLAGQGIGVTVLKLRNNFTQGITGILRTYDSTSFDISRITVRDLTIDGNLANQPTGASPRHIGFYLGAAKQGGKWCQDVLVERVEVKNCRSYGFDPHERSRRLTFRDCTAHDNGIMGSANTYEQSTGITVDWCTDLAIENSSFYRNSDHGIELVTDARRCIVRGNHSYSNGTTGIVLQRGTPDTATLSAAISSAGATSITVSGTASTLGSPANGVTGDPNYVIRVDSEEMVVTATSGSTMTVTRGAYGTTAATHSNGATVQRVGWVDTVTGLVARSSDFNTVSSNRVWGNGAQGIKVVGNRNEIIGNMAAVNCLTTAGINLDVAGTGTAPTFGGSYNHVADNRIVVASPGLATYALGESNDACDYNTFSNNHIEGTGSSGVTRIRGANTILVDAFDDAVPQSLVGEPDGVAPLDGAGVLPAYLLAGRAPEDFGAAPAQHAHGFADLPDVARVLGTGLLIVKYDEDAEQWESTRAGLVLRPGQQVLWWGNAEPPADADDDDLHFFDAAAVPLPPVDPPDPPSSTRDVNGVVLNEPDVTVTGQTANLSALLNTNAAKTFTYLQFALRRTGDNASGDTGHQNNLAVDGDYTLTASKAGLGAGDWTAFLAYSIDGTTWFNGPATEFEVEAPTGSPAAASLIGRSGLPWNAGLFYQAGSLTAANNFATWRNRPLDSIMYFTGRDKWSDLAWFRSDLTAWPGYRVICVPFQPQLRNSSGATNPEGGINTATASGANNSRWTTWAQALKAAGWDDGRTIVRLSWESNGDWYDWGWGRTDHYPTANGAITAFTGAWVNVVNSIRAVAPTCLFDINVNRGNTRSGINFFTDILDPLQDYYDIIGLDWYNHAPAQLSQGEFDSTAAQTYSGNDLHAYCVTNSKLLSLDEWGVSHGVAGSYAGGGDDPNWIARMWTYMQGKAYGNGGRLIQEITYNDPGAPTALMHSLYNPEQNPNAAAAYKSTSRWGRA